MPSEVSTDGKDELYWTKGKWRDYLQQEKEQEQNLERESDAEVRKE
jgi:hypothetical protein